MIRCWLIVPLIFVFGLMSCKEDKPPIPPQEMAPILADLHLADAASALVSTDTPKRHGVKNDDTLAIWTVQILKQHHKTVAEFNEGLQWYRDRPDLLDSLYEKVIPILEAKKKVKR
jgi:hypothetical protein